MVTMVLHQCSGQHAVRKRDPRVLFPPPKNQQQLTSVATINRCIDLNYNDSKNFLTLELYGSIRLLEHDESTL